MSDDREITITIRGKNMTQAEFDAARKNLFGVEEQTKKTTASTSTLGSAFKAVGGILAAWGITSAIRDFTQVTGALTDMSLKTGIGVEALQRLKYAAEQNGGSLEQVTGAITKLGANLAGGKESALGALEALGLKFDDIRNMAPDQAFTTIADAIAKIPDPMAQSKLAMDLFGKSGAELLPMMKGNLSETAAAADRLGIVMSASAVAAGDEFGDTMDTLILIGKSLIAQVLEPIVPTLTTLAQWFGEKLPGALRFLIDALQIGLARSFMEAKIKVREFLLGVAEGINSIPLLGEKIGFSATTVARLRSNLDESRQALAIFDTQTRTTASTQETAAATITKLNLNYSENEKANTKAAAANQKAHKVLAEFNEEVDKTNAAIARGMATHADFTKAISGHTDRVADAIIKEALLRMEYDKTAASQRALFQNLEQEARKAREEQEREIAGQRVLFANLETAAKRSSSAIGAAFKNIGSTIIGSLQGGGNVLESVGSTMGQALGTDVAKHFSTGLTNLLGQSLGNAVGAMLPGLGALLGPLLGKLSGLFGISKEVKEARGAVAELEASIAQSLTAQQRAEAGGEKWKMTVIGVRDAFLSIGGTAQEAEALVRQLWDTDHPERAKTAIEAINQALKAHQDQLALTNEDTKPTWQEMQAAAEKYGIDLAALGPAFESGRLADQFTGIWQSFQMLTQAGADVGGVLVGMKDELIEMAATAARTGSKIPAQFRPLLENLAESTELTDEQRRALKALGDESFGPPIIDQQQQIADKLGEILDGIRDLIGGIGNFGTSAAASFGAARQAAHDFANDMRNLSAEGGFDFNVSGARGFAGGTGMEFPDFGGGTPAILHHREAVVPYADRIPTARKWLSESGGGAAAAVYLNVIVDKSGDVRQLSDEEFVVARVQSALNQSRIVVPQKSLVARAGV